MKAVDKYPFAMSGVADKLIAQALELPHDHQLRLIRALAEDMAFSYGADDIERGCRIIECDLRDDARANDAGLTLAAYRAAEVG